MSESPYGTFDQGGNVWEWNESIAIGFPLARVVRGGSSITIYSNELQATAWNSADPSFEEFRFGFRVARIPESLLPGDYNHNGVVDAADYIVWRKGLGTTYTQSDYEVWRAHFGQTAGSGTALPSAESLPVAVPEPSALVLLSFGLAALVATRPARPTQRGGERNN